MDYNFDPSYLTEDERPEVEPSPLPPLGGEVAAPVREPVPARTPVSSPRDPPITDDNQPPSAGTPSTSTSSRGSNFDPSFLLEERDLQPIGRPVGAKPPDKPDDHWAITRGVVTGLGQAPSTMGWAITGLNDLAGGDPNNAFAKAAKSLQQSGDTTGGGYEMQVGDYSKIGSIGDAWTYAMESIGQGIGSSLTTLGGAAVGGGIGAVTPVPGGAAVGAIAGGFAANQIQAYGGMLQQLHEDKDIQKMLADGTITRSELAGVAIPPSIGIAALDTAALGKLAKMTGIGRDVLEQGAKAAVKEGIKAGLLRVGKGAAEGGATEGVTEGVQQAIGNFVQKTVSGKGWDDEDTKATVDAAFRGLIPGGAFGAAANMRGGKPGAAPKRHGTTGTGEDVPDEVVKPETDPGTSTPGQPGGTPPKEPPNAPETATPDEKKPDIAPTPPPDLKMPDMGVDVDVAETLSGERHPNEFPASGAAPTAGETVEGPGFTMAPGTEEEVAVPTDEELGISPEEMKRIAGVAGVEAPIGTGLDIPKVEIEAPVKEQVAQATRTQVSQSGDTLVQAMKADETINPPPAPAPQVGTAAEAAPQVEPVEPITPGVTPDAEQPPTRGGPEAAASPVTEAPVGASVVGPAPVETQAPEPVQPAAPAIPMAGVEEVTAQPEPPAQPATSLPAASAVTPEETALTEAMAAPPPEEPPAMAPRTFEVVSKRRGRPAVIQTKAPAPANVPIQTAVSPREQVRRELRAHARESLVSQGETREDILTQASEAGVRRAEQFLTTYNGGLSGRELVERLKPQVADVARQHREATTTREQLHSRVTERAKARRMVEVQEQKTREETEAKAGEDIRQRQARLSATKQEVPSATIRNASPKANTQKAENLKANLEKAGKPVPAYIEKIAKAKRQLSTLPKNSKDPLVILKKQNLNAEIATGIDTWIGTLERDERAAEATKPKVDTEQKVAEQTKEERRITEAKKADPDEQLVSQSKQYAPMVERATKAVKPNLDYLDDQQDPESYSARRLAAGIRKATRDFFTSRAKNVGAGKAANTPHGPKALPDHRHDSYPPFLNFLIYANGKLSVLERDDNSPAASMQRQEALIDIRQAYEMTRDEELVDFKAIADAEQREKIAAPTVKGEEGEQTRTMTAEEQTAGQDVEEFYRREQAVEEDPDIEAMRAPTSEQMAAGKAPFTRKGQTLTNHATGFTYTLKDRADFKARDIAKVGQFPMARFRAVWGLIDRKVSQILDGLVGDTRTFVLPDDVVQKLFHVPGNAKIDAAGFYSRPTLAERAKGDNGLIVISESSYADKPFLAHVMKHEMVHAATIFAYDSNYKNTRRMADVLYTKALTVAMAETGLTKAQLIRHPEYGYGFTNAKEFLAEGLSKPEFQTFLTNLKTPIDPFLANIIKGTDTTSFIRSIWDTLVDMVARIIGADGLGHQGTTYTEGVLRLAGSMAMSPAEAQDYAKKLIAQGTTQMHGSVTASPITNPAQAYDQTHEAAEPLIKAGLTEAASHLNAMMDGSGHRSIMRRMRHRYLSTTLDLRRLTDKHFPPNSPLHKAVDAMLRKAVTAAGLAEDGNAAAIAFHQFALANPKEAAQVAVWLDGNTREGVDGRHPANHSTNAYFGSGAGAKNFRLERQRASHAKYAKEWLGFSQAQKDVINKTAAAYGKMQRTAVREIATSILKAATKSGALNLPTTFDQAVNWVITGGIDRTGNTMTQYDKNLHAALGPVAAKLQQATSVRTARGLYVPLMRRGGYVVSAKRDYSNPKHVPKGAHAVSGTDNEFIFTNDADYQNYVRNTEDQIIDVKGQGQWRKVTVQNRFLSFFENQAKAEQERARLIRDGIYQDHEVEGVQHRRDGLSSNDELLPNQLKALIKSVQQMGLSPGAMKAAEQGIINGHIQLMSGNRAQHRNLGREFVKGSSMDMVAAMRDYTEGFSHYVASLQEGPAVKDGIEWAKEYNRNHPADDVMRRQEIVEELERRNDKNDNFKDHAAFRISSAVSYLSHLFTPAYIATQMSQMAFSTFPTLNGRYGAGRSSVAMKNAFKAIGMKDLTLASLKNWKEAIKDLGGAGNADINHSKALLERSGIKGTWRETVLRKVIDQGLMDTDAGTEMDVKTIGRGRIEDGLNRMARTLRSLTQGIETMNRAVTALATAELEMQKNPKLSIDEVAQKAAYTVEETQGGYGAMNSPTVFNNPLGRTLLQFKKYALFTGNFLARQIAASFSSWKGPEAREARRTLAWTFGMYMLAAGASGALPWEFITLPLLVLGIGEDPRDWIQQKSRQLAVALGMGASSKTISEVFTRGLPRLLGFDLSNRISLSSLLSFGEPKDMKPESIKAWLFDNFAGPQVGMITDVGKFLSSGGDMSKFPVKIVRDTTKAFQAGREGTTTSTGKRSLTPYSVGESITKGLGFATAREAEKYEPGGDVWEKQEKGRGNEEKRSMQDKWLKADTLKDTAAKERAWQAIVEWNKGQPREMRIDRGHLYQLRQRRATEARKEEREGKRRDARQAAGL